MKGHIQAWLGLSTACNKPTTTQLRLPLPLCCKQQGPPLTACIMGLLAIWLAIDSSPPRPPCACAGGRDHR